MENRRIVHKVIYEGKPAKLEIINKTQKLYKALPVHKHALKKGIRVAEIYNIEEKDGMIYKYTEWVQGNTIRDEMARNPNLIEPICMDLARYMIQCYDADGIIPEDCHTENFVWYNNKEVVYIDLKKLLFGDYEWYMEHMSKICLKSCRGDRKKTLAFLKGYSVYKDVTPVLEDCTKRGWSWQPLKGNPFVIEPITIEEVKNGI
jgi:hypothetical protein